MIKQGLISIPCLLEDIERALQANAQFSALAMTLALVAECAEVQYPEIKSDGEKFATWYDDWFNSHNCDESIKEKMDEYAQKREERRHTEYGKLPQLNGELLYKLRCKLFHEASTDVEFYKLKDDGNKDITNFSFAIGIGGMSSGICDKSEKDVSMRIDIPWLVEDLTHLIRLFYERNKDKIFHEISVVDNTGYYVRKEP